MQEALRLGDAETVDQDADHPDAEAVHQDGDRHRRQEQDDLLPERPLVKDGEQEAEAHQREQVAKAAARLGHLQLVDAEIDDVAVEIDRHAERPR